MHENGPSLEATSDPRRFFWRLLLTASSIAAVVSLLTTGIGLDRYVSSPLAWSLALAVQLGLFGLAWLIGAGRARMGWVCGLSAVTMLFSVTFSYVTLQSELTSEIRPAEARRALFDTARQQLSEARRLVDSGVQQSETLELRLASWLAMERQDGWATRTCEVEDHCYLRETCERIRQRIERWERETGQTYREGPGEKLIFGTLQTELATLEQLGRRIADARRQLDGGHGVLDDGIDNQERLRRLDTVMGGVPVNDLEAMTCQTVVPPTPPAYGDHARDRAAGEERPVYAFQDLAEILTAGHTLGREDYPTLFAFALAVFIDLFVLVVAIGASTLVGHGPDGLPDDALHGPYEQVLQRDIEGWLLAALVDGGDDLAARRSFLGELLAAVDFGGKGDARLIPETTEQRRFGHLLVQARAARVEPFVAFNRIGRRFHLENWVVPALTRHLRHAAPALAG